MIFPVTAVISKAMGKYIRPKTANSDTAQGEGKLWFFEASARYISTGRKDQKPIKINLKRGVKRPFWMSVN